MLTIGLVLMGLLVLVAVVAPLVLGDAAGTLTDDRRQGSSPDHLLGTDEFGRDLLSRALVATRLTLVLTFSATAISVVFGVAVGLLVWMLPQRARDFVLTANAVAVAFPALVLALVIAAVLGPGAVSATIAVGVAGIPAFVRLSANMAAPIMVRDYVSTAGLLNVPRPVILLRHVLPNLGEPLLVLSANSFAVTLTELSGLSFIGLGVQNPDYDFGRLLADGLPNAYTQPIQIVGPSLMLVLTGVAAMFIGDGLAARSNPRLRRLVRGRLSGTLRRADDISRDLADAHARRAREDAPREPAAPAEPVLRVRDLRVETAQGRPLVRGVSFDVAPGEILGLVGESGSGKSLTAMSAAGLVPDGVNATASVLTAAGHDLLGPVRAAELARDVALVYQDPVSTFNPALRLDGQLTEVPRVHLGMGRRQARRALAEMFGRLRISRPESRGAQHPHELSGGMLQRAMISSALLTEATLIIADEPTTALDVTVQAEVLRRFVEASESLGAAVLFISHDLGVVEALCDRVLVMNGGEVVEELTRDRLARGEAEHPYTRSLLAAARYVEPPEPGRAGASVRKADASGEGVVREDGAAQRGSALEGAARRDQAREDGPAQWGSAQGEDAVRRDSARQGAAQDDHAAQRDSVRDDGPERPAVEVDGLGVVFGSGASRTDALRDVTFTVPHGRSVGLVGESGSGKSTLAKVLVGLVPIGAGRVVLDGERFDPATPRRRRDPGLLQLIPQDPFSSLSPRRTAGQALAEALDPRRADTGRHRDEIGEWFERVGLPASAADRYPHEFSGGQRQRIAIARALCVRPRMVIADEITSALDLSVQAEILELLARLRAELDLTMLFISHDLAVVRHVSDDVAVLRSGELREFGGVEQVFTDPRDEYTRLLLDSVPGAPGFRVRD
ncbi:ATP-binding cassette domain-containing protein [Nocardiopsis flavescens]|uniref:ATP-binding cassette domain-containing protein n=1 Tax=Nocardiopsis flavescens TaxID=758803 RepID=UPI00365B9549